MPARTAKANVKKSKVRAHIEHVFAEQKARMGLFVRTGARDEEPKLNGVVINDAHGGDG